MKIETTTVAPLALLLAGLMFASLPAEAQTPLLVDRELFLGDPEISGAQLSPDGQLIAFIKPY